MNEFIFLGAICAVVILFVLIFSSDEKKDNRELYYRNMQGQAWAIMVRGRIGHVPNHENILHDGTPHQNPVIMTEDIKSWFLFFPITTTFETRWYPLTVSDKEAPTMKRIKQRIINRQKLGEDVQLVVMDNEIERKARITENQTQVGKGNRPMYNRKGEF